MYILQGILLILVVAFAAWQWLLCLKFVVVVAAPISLPSLPSFHARSDPTPPAVPKLTPKGCL